MTDLRHEFSSCYSEEVDDPVIAPLSDSTLETVQRLLTERSQPAIGVPQVNYGTLYRYGNCDDASSGSQYQAVLVNNHPHRLCR